MVSVGVVLPSVTGYLQISSIYLRRNVLLMLAENSQPLELICKLSNFVVFYKQQNFQ